MSTDISQLEAVRRIGLLRESESQENPLALDRRVALVPKDVEKLVMRGVEFNVENGAGEGMGYSDEDYLRVGATLQRAPDIYQNQDLLVKLKGPADESIEWMSRGTALFCMAHLKSFPGRAALLREQGVQILEMELLQEECVEEEEQLFVSQFAVDHAIEPFIERNCYVDLNVYVVGFTKRLGRCIRRLANLNPKSLLVLPEGSEIDTSSGGTKGDMLFYDSAGLGTMPLISSLCGVKENVSDIDSFFQAYEQHALHYIRSTNLRGIKKFRRIQCLNESGICGARYGIGLLLNESKVVRSANQINVAVLGYGNVAMGAIEECHRQGVRSIMVLGRRHTIAGQIEKYLYAADLIINGAESSPQVKRKRFILSKEQIARSVRKGSVIIDLVGGTPDNRGPVENIVECTYLPNPYFVEDGIYFSAMWGWPMIGMKRLSCKRYSAQIAEVIEGFLCSEG